MVTQLSLLPSRSGSRAHLDFNRQQQLASCLINSLDLRLPLLPHTRTITTSAAELCVYCVSTGQSFTSTYRPFALSTLLPVSIPSITPKTTATKAAAFVWDAFPPPPPEAENWQPDPNSIPKAGNLPDPRFNRDPEQDRRSKSYRKEAKMYGQALSESASSPSTKESSLGRGLGQWPAPAARSTGFPRDFVQDVKPTSPSLESVTVLKSRKYPSISTKPTPRIDGPPKGTMELMPAPNYRRPETPVSRAPGKSASPTKSLSSVWASLEKAIAEDERKLDVSVVTATGSKISSRPESVRKKSIPPHLRSKSGEGKTIPPISSAQSFNPSLNPRAKAYDVMAWEMVSADSGIEHAKHVSISNCILPTFTKVS